MAFLFYNHFVSGNYIVFADRSKKNGRRRVLTRNLATRKVEAVAASSNGNRYLLAPFWQLPIEDAGGGGGNDVAASFTASPSSATVNQSIGFDASSSTGADLSYSWDFDASDGLSEDATGAQASTTYAQAGTYTVTLTITDSSGSTASQTLDVVVTAPAPQADPTEADLDINGGSAPFTFGSEFTFDAGAVGGTNHRWSFGDGSSADGVYATKTYDDPGKYTVSLSYTTDGGESKTITTEVAQYDEIHNLPNTRAATDDSRIVFDVEFPLDGYIYEWDLGDGDIVRDSRVEKDYSNSTAPGSDSSLGFYDVALNIYDAQPDSSALSTAAVTPELVATQFTRVNIYQQKPVATFDTQHSQSTDGITVAGYAPFTVNFDASASTTGVTNSLTYAWDFGDGTTDTGATSSKVYEESGRYLVTLIITDEYGQTATSHDFIYVMKPRHRIITSVRYQQQNRASAVANLEAELRELEAQVLNGDTSQPGLSSQGMITTQAAANVYDDFYPMVSHTSGYIQSAIFYPTGSFFIRQGVLTYINGVEVTPNVSTGVIAAGNQGNPNEWWNSILFLRNSLTGALRDGTSSVQTIHSSQLFDLKYDAFSGLSVPRVSISILPDAQMPGDLASPHITESTIEVGGKTELLLQVTIRESEALSYAEFDVPVYALNEAGSHLKNINGLFRAKFDSLTTSEVKDGVMVNGKSFIKARLPLNIYGNGQPVDLTRVRVYTNNPDCDGAVLYRLGYESGDSTLSQVKSGLGCANITATHDAPTNTDVSAYGFDVPADFSVQSNKIVLGSDTLQAYDDNLKDVPADVARLVIGFLPIIGDSVDFIEQAFNSAIGAEVDEVLVTVAAAGLILDITTGGVGDLTAPIKGVYRFSLIAAKQGTGGALSFALKNTVGQAINAGKNAGQIISGIGDVFGTSIRVTFKCGFGCLKQADTAVTDLARVAGEAPETAFKQLNVGLEDVAEADIPASCLLQATSDLAQAGYSVAGVSLLFMGITPSEESGSANSFIETQVIKSKATCPYAQLNVNIRADPVNQARYAGVPTLKNGKPVGTSPHHIVPLKEFTSSRCVRGGRNVCQEARDVMTKYDINLNDGDNGVFLPFTDASPLLTKYPNATKHDRANFHTLNYYEAVADGLAEVVEELSALNKTDAEIAQQLRTNLQEVATSLLAGSFPK